MSSKLNGAIPGSTKRPHAATFGARWMATPTPIQNTARTPCNKNERGYALVSAMILLVVVTL